MALALIAHRRRLGLTQKGLAQATGGRLSIALVGAVEAGDRNLGHDSVEALATALELTDEQRAELHLARARTRAVLDPLAVPAADASRTLTDDDVEAIARRVAQLLADREDT